VKRAGAALVVLLLLAFAVVPGLVERRMNPVGTASHVTVSPRALALHRTLAVADLHADSLLWGRDLVVRGNHGQVDVPRLREAGVAIQMFTIVTKSPRNLNIERNDDTSDDITLLALAQRWPPRTWRSLAERALYQAGRLEAMAARSGGALTLVRSAADLEGSLRRHSKTGQVAGLLGIEGAHALDGDLANLDRFFDAGIRMLSPSHFFDTDIGGSAHGVAKGGLTDKGRELVRRMETKRMLVDVAHASPQTFDDVIGMATRPVVVSHAGVKGTCDNRRNLSDAQLRAVARTGGVVGIGVWDTAVCGNDAGAIARAMRHAAAVAGVEHVGLGSDFDGAVAAPFDVTGLPELTAALLDAGFSDADVARLMGGNVARLLRETLP
jgi:microsomal dipeptidase-like Zn-dependent dipeptidase